MVVEDKEATDGSEEEEEDFTVTVIRIRTGETPVLARIVKAVMHLLTVGMVEKGVGITLKW